jgi:hypothetical protein
MRSQNDLNPRDLRIYRRVILRRTFSYLGAGLVISAIVGGLYRDRMHFIWALCAIGAIFLAYGWLEYLKMTDSLPFFHTKKAKNVKTPFIWRNQKQKKWHKPAFMQNSEDFEDDLTAQTIADIEIFSEKRQSVALIISRAAAGILLLIASFVIPQ